VKGSVHKKHSFAFGQPRNDYHKADLFKMIHENESKIKLLQQASPLISNAEAIHGSRRANCEMKSPSNTVLPLGKLN
jgi:hypothetical protein